MLKKLALIMCIPLVLLGDSSPKLKYKDIFKNIEKRDSLKEYNKKERLQKIDQESQKIIANIEALIKKKN